MNENGKEPEQQQEAPARLGMRPVQRALGLLWLPVHVLLLPILGAIWNRASQTPLSAPQFNLALYAVSALALLLIMFGWWREEFYTVLDHPGRCVSSILLGGAADYAMNIAVGALLLLFLGGELDNPNNAAVLELADQEPGTIRAAAIFLAPLVEETLVRGVVFGSLRRKHRALAYAVSALVFCLMHVWQPVLVTQDLRLLIYALQYLPLALALAWCYERSDSIWCPIALHMLVNVLAFTVLGM